MKNSLPKAILFDLDDTILAFSESAEPTWRKICEKFAFRVEGLKAEALFEAIRQSRTWFWQNPERHRRGRLNLGMARREIVAGGFHRLKINYGTLANEIADSYTSKREETVQPFPGAIEALHRLRGKGIHLALITNGNAEGQRRKIEKFGLANLFDYILVEDEFGVGKPDERVYVHSLDRLNVEPEDTWMIGDNLDWDVKGPQRLGIFAIWVDFAGKGLPDATQVHPDRIIRNLSEILEE